MDGKWQNDAGRLFDAAGHRKYLRESEAHRFIRSAKAFDPQTAAFCLLLAYSGCRLSEALGVAGEHLDQEADQVVFRTLKRRRTTYRSVPVPAKLMRTLRELAGDELTATLWPWCRQTAWRRVKAVMEAASIDGTHAVPKGLRHSFGIRAATYNVPIALTQRWMGHARAETTAIYQQALGPEERAFAARLWDGEA